MTQDSKPKSDLPEGVEYKLHVNKSSKKQGVYDYRGELHWINPGTNKMIAVVVPKKAPTKTIE